MPNNSERQRAQGRDWLFAAVVVVVFTVTGSVILRSIDPQWFAAIGAIGALLAEGLIAAAILRRSQRVGPELARYARNLPGRGSPRILENVSESSTPASARRTREEIQ